MGKSNSSKDDVKRKEVEKDEDLIKALKELTALEFKALDDTDYYVRMVAKISLGEIEEGRALELLIEALKDENMVVRKAAARTLGKIGDKNAVEPLIEALKDENGGVRKAAAAALGKIKDKRAVEPLIEILNENIESIPLQLFKKIAISALGKINDPRAVKPLIQALKDRNHYVQKEAVDVLVDFGDESVEPLIEALKDENTIIRIMAAKVLGKIKDKRAVEPLIRSLEDESGGFRRGAVWALGEIGEPVEPLIQALKDKEPSVRREALEALEKIRVDRMRVEKRVKSLIESLKYGNFDYWEEVVLHFREIGKPAVELLIQALRNENWLIRWAAVRALGYIEDERAVEPLKQVLTDDVWEIRMAAAISLRKIINEDAEGFLNQVLNDKISIYAFERLNLIESIIKQYANSRSYSSYDFQEDFLRFNPIEYEMIMEKIGYHTNLIDWECKEEYDLFLDAMKELSDYMTSSDNTVKAEAMKVFTNAQSEVRRIDSEYSNAWRVKEELNKDKYWNMVVYSMGEEDPELREAAKKAVKGFSIYVKFPALYSMLENKNPHVRRGMREALADAIWEVYCDEDFPLKEFYNYLIEAAGQEDDDIRKKIMSETGRFGSPHFTDILVEKIRNSPNEWIRKYSAETIIRQEYGCTDVRKAVDALIVALKDPSPKVRKKAVESMGEFFWYLDPYYRPRPEKNPFTDPLIKALSDEDQEVRETSLNALKQIGVEDVDKYIRENFTN